MYALCYIYINVKHPQHLSAVAKGRRPRFHEAKTGQALGGWLYISIAQQETTGQSPAKSFKDL